ncbi:MAG: type I phosphomannose isomerase catalytic subunit [Chthoniobacterales bacterium]
MSASAVLPEQPLVFQPLFMERIWGGRRLETLYGKRLPPGAPIGESWEIVDRPEAQSVVREGAWRGRTLHELWVDQRAQIFGPVQGAARFPLLIKLLDAQEKLSLQVHPPAEIAAELGGEPKTECWYIAEACPGAELYVGIKKGVSRAQIEAAVAAGAVEEHVHRVPVRTGDAMFLPSGRMHAIGAGNVIVEIQQNSDTTYRVFDWKRVQSDGTPRKLHIKESLRSINFEDFEPGLVAPAGESLVKDLLFEIQKWELSAPREVSTRGTFAIVICLAGAVACAGTVLKPGEVFLVPANLTDRNLTPSAENTALLRVTVPA